MLDGVRDEARRGRGGRAAAEARRLAALRLYAVLDTAPEQVFDDLAELAAHLCETPMAAVSLIDEHREWFKARIGLSPAQVPRAFSISAHVIHAAGVFVVPDTAADARFARWPFVDDGPTIRFYAGVPLTAATGEAIGALSVLDTAPRTLTPAQARALQIVGRQVMTQLELRRRTLDLAQRERMLSAIVESEPECVKLLGPDGSLQMMNRAGLAMIEADSLDQVAGRSVYPLVLDADREGFQELTERVFRGEQGSLQFQVRGLKGGTRWLETHAVPLRDEHGTVVSLLGITRDVTERKLADAALREGESRLRRAVSAGRVGLWDWDLETNKVYFSAEWKQQIGFEDHEIGDSFDEWQRRVHPDDLPAIHERVRSFLAGDVQEYESEFRLQHKDGSYRRILAQASKVVDGQGRAVGVLGSHVDITEHVELQERFLQAQKMESVGRLAGGIAHDFNNLLTVINGLADLALVSLRDADPLRDDLEQIRQSGERAAIMTRQLLAMSRQQIMKTEVLSLNAVVREMQRMLERLIGEDIALTFDLAADPDTVTSDPGQLEQVILNLAVNARDAMPEGGKLSIATRSVELDAAGAGEFPAVRPGPHVLLAVRDTGVGMDEATRQRIFEPFFTTKERGKGTGLGLSTVYGIVKQSGGGIRVRSRLRLGTAFEIVLPRVDDVPRMRTAPAAPARGAETVLVVEDEPAVRGLTRRILTTAGYAVLEAGSGTEALLLLERHPGPVDLMLTDVVMPGMNGRELAARLQAIRPALKVLYTSGYTDDAILRHGVLDDSSRFLSKPYTPAELRRKVREILDA